MSKKQRRTALPNLHPQQIPVKTVSFDDQGRPINQLTADDFFDDCPICQATKKAYEENRDITLTELEAAFDQAQKLGIGQVGTQADLDNDELEDPLQAEDVDPWFDEIDSRSDEKNAEFFGNSRKRGQ